MAAIEAVAVASANASGPTLNDQLTAVGAGQETSDRDRDVLGDRWNEEASVASRSGWKSANRGERPRCSGRAFSYRLRVRVVGGRRLRRCVGRRRGARVAGAGDGGGRRRRRSASTAIVAALATTAPAFDTRMTMFQSREQRRIALSAVLTKASRMATTLRPSLSFSFNPWWLRAAYRPFGYARRAA